MSTDTSIDTTPMTTGAERVRFFDRYWHPIVKTRTEHIRQYLAAEREQMAAWLAALSPRLVVEAGCADGDLLLPEVLRHHGTAYLGIDIAATAVAAGNRMLAGTGRAGRDVRIVCADVQDLARLAPSLGVPATGVLTAYPFNLLGELRPDPTEALAATAAIGSDIAVFTYDDGDAARDVRLEYYLKCGFSGSWREGPDRLVFRGEDGFFSAAYAQDTVTGWLADLGYQVTTVRLTPFAVGYLGRLHR
ncbi:class I SAM-dependent methyltransferase [Actinocatenispora rupis]|nr:class I SAM-dependent methyltransferase [Actinocatenispora rupis]